MMDVPPGRIRFGKFLVIFVFAMIFGSLAGGLYYVARTKGADFFDFGAGRQYLVVAVCSAVFFAVLAYCTWLGQSWARWVTGFLLFVAGIFILVIFRENRLSLLAGLGVMFALFGLAALITLVPSVGNFIEFQSLRRRFGVTGETDTDAPDA